jgi:tetratricopeptide (TPR) repeat protein
VEFGSVGCAPCRESIPHLSRLAVYYAGKVTITSVFINENRKSDTIGTTYVNRVKKFVDNMGDVIRYHVAIDDPTRIMARTWMDAANENAIPRAFIVRAGKIAWIGGPMALSKVLADLVHGNFDPLAAIEQQNSEGKLSDEVFTAIKSGNREFALKKIDSLIPISPDLFLHKIKFDVLLFQDEKSGYDYGYRVLNNECRDAEPVLYYMARSMIEKFDNLELRNPDWDLAMALTNRAIEISKDDLISAWILNAQAQIYAKQHNYHKAIECQEQAIALLNQVNDHRADDIKEYHLSELERYKKQDRN